MVNDRWHLTGRKKKSIFADANHSLLRNLPFGKQVLLFPFICDPPPQWVWYWWWLTACLERQTASSQQAKPHLCLLK